MFTAATVSDPGVRDRLIERVWNRIGSNGTRAAFFDMYNGSNGPVLHGSAG